MLHHRQLILSFFALSLVLPTLTTSLPFENTDIVRTIELGGSLVQVTTTYNVKALETNPDAYIIALDSEEERKTSWAQAKIKGDLKALPLQNLGYDDKRYRRCHSSSGSVLSGYHLVARIFSRWLYLRLWR